MKGEGVEPEPWMVNGSGWLLVSFYTPMVQAKTEMAILLS
jgi:hypothetical protein